MSWNQQKDKKPQEGQCVWLWRTTWSRLPRKLYYKKGVHWCNPIGSPLVAVDGNDWWHPWQTSDTTPPELPSEEGCK